MSEPLLDYKVNLPVFEGPLDLLLYLIRKEEIDIYDIPVARVTEQYLAYLDLMRDLNLDVAGEFILMAATLAHLKSKELLPKDPNAPEEEEEEGDPRAELTRRLLEYQKYKHAAETLADLPLLGRDTFGRGEAASPDREELRAEQALAGTEPPLDVSLFALLDAFRKAITRFQGDHSYEVEGESVSVAEKARWLAEVLSRRGAVAFHELFEEARRKVEVVATFLALLEMVRLKLVGIHQAAAFGPIQIRSRIPAGTDVVAVLAGTDLERAFAYGVNAPAPVGVPSGETSPAPVPTDASASEEE